MQISCAKKLMHTDGSADMSSVEIYERMARPPSNTLFYYSVSIDAHTRTRVRCDMYIVLCVCSLLFGSFIFFFLVGSNSILVSRNLR